MSIRKHRKRTQTLGLELNMTAMADVVFQLLIYLILTAKPPIVFANLDVNRPQADPNAVNQKIQGMVEISVFSDAFVVQGKRVTSEGLKKAAKDLAALDKTQTVMIKCAWDSPHEKLIEVLDICSENKLSNLSVMSM
jgi:biopolymer transport protein ExbD